MHNLEVWRTPPFIVCFHPLYQSTLFSGKMWTLTLLHFFKISHPHPLKCMDYPLWDGGGGRLSGKLCQCRGGLELSRLGWPCLVSGSLTPMVPPPHPHWHCCVQYKFVFTLQKIELLWVVYTPTHIPEVFKVHYMYPIKDWSFSGT